MKISNESIENESIMIEKLGHVILYFWRQKLRLKSSCFWCYNSNIFGVTVICTKNCVLSRVNLEKMKMIH